MITFKDLGLNPELIEAVDDLGFENPSEIQEKAIPLLLEDQSDLVGLAQTGTGKTAAFGLPLIQQVDTSKKHTQGLILSPTRELCLQITKDFQEYAKHTPNLNIVAVYGGASIAEQSRKIKRGAQVIVATPGRMKDMLRRRMVDISKIHTCVLDEADEMLNMGFYEDITDILKHSPKNKNTWLFSATMPKEVAKIAKKFMNAPTEITVGQKNMGTKNVSHVYYAINSRDRYKALKRLVDSYPGIFAVIFCRTKRGTQKVAERLAEDGYNASALHGDLSQNQRDLVMRSFRNKQIQLLVATDVASRGIDVNDITHVINYQLPDEIEVYTHRSGRTGRAGKEGISVVLTTSREKRKIKQIEKIIQQKFTESKLPSAEEIAHFQLEGQLQKLKETEIHKDIEKYLPKIEEEFADLNKSDILKRILSVELNKILRYYENAPQLNAQGNIDSGEIRYFVNVGSKDGLNWQKLKDFIREELKMTRDEISGVEVKNSFSFFNADKAFKEKILNDLNGKFFEGRQLRIEITKSKKSGKSKRRKSRGKKRGKSKNARRKNIRSSVKRRRKRNN